MKLHTTFTAATSADSRTWLLLHGFLGSSADWAPVCAQHQLQGRILTIDLPAHGQSPALAAEHTTFESVVELLADTIRASVAEPIAGVGYSLGGRLLLGVAAKYPALFSSLTLISAFPGYRSDSERTERAAGDSKWSQRLRELSAEEFLTHWYEQPIFASDRWDSECRLAVLHSRAETLGRKEELARLLEVTSASRMPSYWDFLYDPPISITYLAGERDPRYLGLAEELRHHSPRIHSHIIKDSGHLVVAEKPQDVAAILCALRHAPGQM
jgi:2-succinyl-6-hydroxy-2,4-cyclohexadiene-1-carboxylate synthase